LGAALALATAFSQEGASTDDLRLDPRLRPSIATVDDRFQACNVEMAEVIGARFWKPYANMSATTLPPTEIQVGRDPNLFEARPPADLKNRRLAVDAKLVTSFTLSSGVRDASGTSQVTARSCRPGRAHLDHRDGPGGL
jgi:hypothetical protein